MTRAGQDVDFASGKTAGFAAWQIILIVCQSRASAPTRCYTANRFSVASIGLALLGILAANGVSALAQTLGTPRSGAGSDGAYRQRLDVTFSLSGGYDTYDPPELRRQVDRGGLEADGFSTTLNAAASYLWSPGRRTQLEASNTSVMRYYAQRQQLESVSHGGDIGFSTQLPARLGVTLGQALTYWPGLQLYASIPEFADTITAAAVGAAGDDIPLDRRSYVYKTRAEVSRAIGRANSLSVRGDYNLFLRSNEAIGDVRTYAARVEYSQRLSRNIGASGGLRYRPARWVIP